MGVKGKIDYVVKDNESLASFEVKYSQSLKPWWRYSAVLYGILLEDTIGKPVKRCYIFLTESNALKAINITDESRIFVEHEILSGKTPKPSKSKSCKNCDFNHICTEF